jgi:hypothetical protein
MHAEISTSADYSDRNQDLIQFSLDGLINSEDCGTGEMDESAVTVM